MKDTPHRRVGPHDAPLSGGAAELEGQAGFDTRDAAGCKDCARRPCAASPWTREACNAQETLEAARKQAWDIALLDIRMPGRSGLEVLEEHKKLHPNMPVVMLSAFPEENYGFEC